MSRLSVQLNVLQPLSGLGLQKKEAKKAGVEKLTRNVSIVQEAKALPLCYTHAVVA